MPKCCGVVLSSFLFVCFVVVVLTLIERPHWKARKNLNFLGKDCIGPMAAKVAKLSLAYLKILLQINYKESWLYLLSIYALWGFLFLQKKLFQWPVCQMIFRLLILSLCSAAAVFRESKLNFRCRLKQNGASLGEEKYKGHFFVVFLSVRTWCMKTNVLISFPSSAPS